MKTIWMYWENGKGKRTPKYIDFAIESIQRHRGSLDVRVLSPGSVHEHLSGLRSEWHALAKPAHRADYIRTRLVFEHGGMWLDADMVALGELEPLVTFPKHYDYACQDIATSIGCFVARPGCKLLGEVIKAQDAVLDNLASGFSWNGLGNDLLGKFGKGYPYYQWPECTLDAIAGGRVSKLLAKDESIEENIHPRAVIFHLCNEATGPLIRKYVRDKDLLTSDLLLSRIFRRALGKESDIPAEPRLLDEFARVLWRLGSRLRH
jgi:hypothetical protein